MVDFIGIERVRELVARRGTARFIRELASEIESDYLRWSAFDKSPRHATHSSVGVIELMPASDGRLYAFKYVNGHPKNTAVGLLTPIAARGAQCPWPAAIVGGSSTKIKLETCS